MLFYWRLETYRRRTFLTNFFNRVEADIFIFIGMGVLRLVDELIDLY